MIRTAHTADLDPETLEAARRLLYEVFGAEMTESDWEHCLGGIHALAYDGGEVVGHAAVVQRRLIHQDLALRAGYVEGVAVREAWRRAGVGSALMRELERVIRGAYELGALAASDDALDFYSSLGWTRWEGPTSALTPNGITRTPDDDGGVFVLPVSAELDVCAEIACDWRPGDPW